MRGLETRCVCVRNYFFLPPINFDDCLRQVPIDPAHVRSFLNTAVFGTFVTKITIMHAYQTCIKRIVRFANSLQVRSLTTLKNSDPISSGLCRAPAWRYAKTSCSQHSEFQKKKSSIHLKVLQPTRHQDPKVNNATKFFLLGFHHKHPDCTMAPPQCQLKTTGGVREKKWEMGILDGEFSDFVKEMCF